MEDTHTVQDADKNKQGILLVGGIACCGGLAAVASSPFIGGIFGGLAVVFLLFKKLFNKFR